MDAETVARWQFGITTVYHFLFVPITIAMSMLVAVLQTIWYKTGNDQYLRLTKFFGKLFLINFALGVVTGIVQEFQFGMNWSEYARFVGDIFGAPLALEALLAFFLESTFLGMWIFGWDRLPKKLHLMTIWLAAIGTMLSAVFILAANSWMQHPVGAVFKNGRAQLGVTGDGTLGDGLAGFAQLIVNPAFFPTYLHTLATSYMVAGGLIAGISAWHLLKVKDRINGGEEGEHLQRDSKTYRWATKFGAIIMIVAGVFTVFSGDLLAKEISVSQPAKMAAAEALFESEHNASFSLITIADLDGRNPSVDIRIPGLLSLLAGEDYVHGIKNIEEDYAKYGYFRSTGKEGEYDSVTILQRQVKEAINKGEASPELAEAYKIVDIIPNVPISYWTFRIMIGMGMSSVLIAIGILLSLRKGKSLLPRKITTILLVALPLLPLFAISFGWIFTEMGRQPWIVAGVMPTAMAVSPSVSAGSVLFSLIVYTLVYGALAVIEVGLFWRYAKAGLPEASTVDMKQDDEPLSFAY